MYRQELDITQIKLSDLYQSCTISKAIKLKGHAMDVQISVHKAVKKETIDVNNPKKEISRIPKPWRNADGSKVVEETSA